MNTLHPNAKDISGKRFGRLTAIMPIRRYKNRQVVWLCQCDCGDRAESSGNSLRNGHTTSCGCYIAEITAKRNGKHLLPSKYSNRQKMPEYWVWVSMRARCNNSNNPAWKYYGGRGIGICKEWARSFDAFYEDMGPRSSPKLSIDRINNNGDYEPTNCRWATHKEQMNNTRRCKKRSDGRSGEGNCK